MHQKKGILLLLLCEYEKRTQLWQILLLATVETTIQSSCLYPKDHFCHNYTHDIPPVENSPFTECSSCMTARPCGLPLIHYFYVHPRETCNSQCGISCAYALTFCILLSGLCLYQGKYIPLNMLHSRSCTIHITFQ